MENILVNKDLSFVWHPFTQAKTAPLPIPIARAKGAYLYGYDGRRYFDAISSWWVNLHGHAHPHIIARIAEQAKILDQVVFADFTHAAAIDLAENLLRLLKIEKGRVFYTDNGATAVEAALKIALQYWFNADALGPRKKIISFENAYHGDTFGAMSAAGKNGFNRPFWPFLFEMETIPPPYEGKEEISLECLRKILEKGDVACFIFEPYVQASFGMVKHSLPGLDALMKLCQEHEVITIADEVMTGFGRTGDLFACHGLQHQPDIYCLSKGLTGGYLALGAVACHEAIYGRFLSDRVDHAFLHGHTYCGNALACAAALASLELLEHPKCTLQRKMIEQHHLQFKADWGSHSHLKRCDVAGTILALEFLDKSKSSGTYFSPLKERLKQHFMKHDIFVRPLGSVLYLMPPYCSSQKDISLAYACIQAGLEGSI